MKIQTTAHQDWFTEVSLALTHGKRITISTSKIKKTIVIRKNRKEKGTRTDEFKSKPHSKGVDFSRSAVGLSERMSVNNSTKPEIKMIKVEARINGIIVSSSEEDFLVGSQTYIILKKLPPSSINWNK